METVYLETTLVGHTAAAPHTDPFVAARQRVTRHRWLNDARGFALYISQRVLDECAAGGRTAAAEPFAVVEDLDLLESSDDVELQTYRKRVAPQQNWTDLP